MAKSKTYERIYTIVRRIPAGKVATYGQIARLAGLAGHARQVGYAMNALAHDADVPWHRVINAKGEISKRANPDDEKIQREFLEDEGIEFDGNARVPLTRFQWRDGKLNSDE